MTVDDGSALTGAPAGGRPRRFVRNELLRQARLRSPSPNNPARPLSQRELAEAVNAHVFRTTDRTVALDRHDISRWERGKRRIPTADYRRALRAVLGVATDTELGFAVQQQPPTAGTAPITAGTGPITAQTISPAHRAALDHPEALQGPHHTPRPQPTGATVRPGHLVGSNISLLALSRTARHASA